MRLYKFVCSHFVPITVFEEKAVRSAFMTRNNTIIYSGLFYLLMLKAFIKANVIKPSVHVLFGGLSISLGTGFLLGIHLFSLQLSFVANRVEYEELIEFTRENTGDLMEEYPFANKELGMLSDSELAASGTNPFNVYRV